MNKYLPFALIVAFFLISYSAFINSKGENKNKIYLKIKKYSPYYFEKSLGGLVIKSKNDKNFKEKPSNMEVFHDMDRLQKKWGKAHLKIANKKLIIFDGNKVFQSIKIKDDKELNFLKNYYGIK